MNENVRSHNLKVLSFYDIEIMKIYSLPRYEGEKLLKSRPDNVVKYYMMYNEIKKNKCICRYVFIFNLFLSDLPTF